MHILEKIVLHKKKEIARRKAVNPIDILIKTQAFETQSLSLARYLKAENLSGVIAEFKRRSPSKGVINDQSAIQNVLRGYARSGASAMSVLTDEHFFGGKNEDLIIASHVVMNPILRKDFVIDEYQIFEAKAIGADAILLIAACLSQNEVRKLSALAQSLGLEVLLEVNNREEIGHFCDTVNVIGVNNRNLKTFTTSVGNSHRLLPFLPKDVVKISESGINDPQTAAELQLAGFDGLLIGESFMRHESPEVACAKFVEALQSHKLQLS